MSPLWRHRMRWLSVTFLGFLICFIPQRALGQSNEGKIALSLGTDASHAYFFRGIKNERKGLIVQPYAEVSFSLLEKDEGLNSVKLLIGQRNSLHSAPSGSPETSSYTGIRQRDQTLATWYESDFFSGIALGIENWKADITYASYLSPNHSFGTVQELSFTLTMDDREFFLVPIEPHVGLAIELDGQSDRGSSEGVYFELGIKPRLELLDGVTSIKFPVTLGLSLSNYYENGAGLDNTFGYFDIGAVASLPITAPRSFGEWELTGGVHLLALGGYLETINNGDQLQAVGSIGFHIRY
mgnify:CR=1 FL=1